MEQPDDRGPELTPPAGTAPLVTVIALCYNHARFLRETLESIRTQTYEAIQWIIIDDASQDGSPEVIRQWVSDHDIDCTLLLHERNMGICASLNDGLSHAKGEYVAIVATDDVWLPEKISLQVAAMERLGPDVGVVYTDAAVVDEDGQTLHPSILALWGFPEAPRDLFLQLLQVNPVPAPTALTRKVCFDVLGNYDESLHFEDLDMWLRIARRYRFSYVDQVLALYRVVKTSMSHQRSTRALESTLRIHLKWRGAGQESDRILKRTIPDMVWRLYRHDDEHVGRHVGIAVRLAPSARTVAVYVLLRLGIRHTHLRAFKRRLRLAAVRTRGCAAERDLSP